MSPVKEISQSSQPPGAPRPGSAPAGSSPSRSASGSPTAPTGAPHPPQTPKIGQLPPPHLGNSRRAPPYLLAAPLRLHHHGNAELPPPCSGRFSPSPAPQGSWPPHLLPTAATSKILPYTPNPTPPFPKQKPQRTNRPRRFFFFIP